MMLRVAEYSGCIMKTDTGFFVDTSAWSLPEDVFEDFDETQSDFLSALKLDFIDSEDGLIGIGFRDEAAEWLVQRPTVIGRALRSWLATKDLPRN
jgi:hypothetical protein